MTLGRGTLQARVNRVAKLYLQQPSEVLQLLLINRPAKLEALTASRGADQKDGDPLDRLEKGVPPEEKRAEKKDFEVPDPTPVEEPVNAPADFKEADCNSYHPEEKHQQRMLHG
jgi:hypothetical protein